MENRTFVGSNNSPALTEHGWHLSDWLNAARINQFGCDLTIRTKKEPGVWQARMSIEHIFASAQFFLHNAAFVATIEKPIYITHVNWTKVKIRSRL